MHARILVVGTLMAMCSLANATDQKEQGRYGAKALKGDYYTYGGTLGEMTPPTQKDRKLSFMFTGELAKDLFDQIGPDVKDACSSGPNYRERRRGDLDCIFTKEEGYACHVGLDVRTGKSLIGSIC